MGGGKGRRGGGNRERGRTEKGVRKTQREMGRENYGGGRGLGAGRGEEETKTVMGGSENKGED